MMPGDLVWVMISAPMFDPTFVAHFVTNVELSVAMLIKLNEYGLNMVLWRGGLRSTYHHHLKPIDVP